MVKWTNRKKPQQFIRSRDGQKNQCGALRCKHLESGVVGSRCIHAAVAETVSCWNTAQQTTHCSLTTVPIRGAQCGGCGPPHRPCLLINWHTINSIHVIKMDNTKLVLKLLFYSSACAGSAPGPHFQGLCHPSSPTVALLLAPLGLPSPRLPDLVIHPLIYSMSLRTPEDGHPYFT